ncbi:MAG: hypothetical protein ONB44_24805, partial [candidate division KSB1 bacterium]|nr:hypothetical protein [candidate division KSB1 bacterium]MDZ7314446.1 hypothetical protein [candidate division KSB1 bacterium]
ARDKVVSRNQNFEVTARLLKTGQASVRGTAKIELILPSDPRIEPAQNYRTAEPLQKELADGVVTWQITARSQPSTVIDNIRLRLLRPYPVDENTDSLATVEDVEVAIPVQTESKRLIVQSLPQTVLGPVALGESSSLLMRLKLTNQGDLNSTNILLRGFTWRVRDRENKPVPANQAIKALHLVVTNHPEHVLGSLTAIPVSDTVRMSLTALDTLIGGVPDSVDVLVDVADNKSAKTFQLAFASATDVDAIDQDSRDPVEIVFLDDRGTTVDAGAIASKMRVVIEANYQKSFYNFPNPFSPRSSNPEEKVTYFNYFLPQASDVEFRIFTLLGELVYARSFKSTDPQGAAGPRGNAGYIVWDGHNGDGREVLNGVYIAILKTSAGTVSTKVAVVK